MMKHLNLLLLFVCATLTANAQTDEESIRAVITSAYVDGLQNRGSSEDIRKGFHPSFAMLRFVENNVKPYPIEEWIAAIEKSKAENTPAQPRAEGKFISIDVTGNAAVVKLELYRGGKRTFTDYLTLYKFSEGWRIVSKIYNRHS
jgi:hypothetical protein